MKYIFILFALSLGCWGQACTPPNYIGPPNYPCGSSSTSNPGMVNFMFNSTAPTATTCIGDCQNTKKEDTTIPGHVSGSNLITRISDGATTFQGRSVGNLTISGGDNDQMWSYPNGTFLWTTLTGSWVQPWQLDTSTNAVQVVNSGCSPLHFQSGGAFATSWVNDRTYYYFVDGAKTGSALIQGTLSGSGCGLSVSTSTIFDFMATDNCPGVTPFNIGSKGVMAVTTDDDTFIVSMGPGGQGSADWTFAWSRTKGCSSVNWKTGSVWAYCTSSCSGASSLGTMASGAGNCWGSNGSSSLGIHDQLTTFDPSGQYAFATPTYPWTQGGCAGIASTQGGIAVWQVGTLGNQWCANKAGGTNYLCGAHASAGIDKYLNPNSSGWTVRNAATVSSFTQFLTDPGENQEHCSWPHNNNGTFDDGLPWICGSSDASAAQKSGCTGGFTQAPYCPNYIQNVVFAVFPFATFPPGKILVFAHNGSCSDSGGEKCADGIADGFGPGQSIGVVSPKGDMFAFASSQWHLMGNDNSAVPRGDIFAIWLGRSGGATPGGVTTLKGAVRSIGPVIFR